MSEHSFTVRDIIEGVSRLPAAPRIMPKLQALLRDPNSSLSDITRLLRLDSALSAQIVRLSNSAYYGSAEKVGDIESAVNRVGFYEVFKLVGVVASHNVLAGRLTLYNLESGELWRNSIAAGSMLSSLAHLVSISEDSAYMTGLLHGLGKIVIDTYYAEQGIEYEMSGLRSVTPEEEYYALGFTHAQVGGALLNKWNFIPDIALPVEYQLNPMSAPEDYRRLSALLHLGLLMLECHHDNPEQAGEYFDPDPDILTELGLTHNDLLDAATRAEQATDTLISSLGPDAKSPL